MCNICILSFLKKSSQYIAYTLDTCVRESVTEVGTHAELNGSVRGPCCAATVAFSWKASLLGLQLFNALIYTSKHSAKAIVLWGWRRGEAMGVMRGAFIPLSLFIFLLSRGLGGCGRGDKLRWDKEAIP